MLTAINGAGLHKSHNAVTSFSLPLTGQYQQHKLYSGVAGLAGKLAKFFNISPAVFVPG